MNDMCVRKWKFVYVFLPIYASVYAIAYVQKSDGGHTGCVFVSAPPLQLRILQF